MADNSAARANFEELKNHITLASKRVKALEPGTDAHNKCLEDLEDYYERAVQLRRLQAETALEERNEAMQKFRGTKMILVSSIAILLLIILLQFVWLMPDTALVMWRYLQPFVTIDRLFIVVVILIIGKKRQ